ncbi:MAG: tetratricopeptide repeat protein [Verrucomicrobia bacterium]|nr:tetratricopeptide repeat protein [Verrucomicrobiota bacterium]
MRIFWTHQCGRIACFLLAFSAVAPGLWLKGQVPLVSDGIAEVELEDTIEGSWQVAAAERAQAAGLASLAESIYRRLLLREATVNIAQATSLKLGLAKALIGQGRYVAARAQLESVPEDLWDARHGLYLAVALYGEGGPRIDADGFRRALARVKPEELPSGDLPWFSFLEGLDAALQGNPEEARAAFNRAAELAESDELRWHFESLALRQEMRSGPADELMVPELRSRLRSLEGEAAAFPFVREYAVLLHRLGRSAEAVDAIDRELDNNSAGYGGRQRGQLRLLKGLILGAESDAGRAALKELIRSGESRDLMGIALQLLARVPDGDDDLFEFLKVMISQTERHPLLGQMYYLRSQLALRFPDDPEMVALAERDARTLLEQFPGLSSVTNVYRLLAFAALNREPPQYRTAADFLIQLRDQAEAPADLVGLNQLIGDCYFLNGDFANAVDFYTVARNRQLVADANPELFMRLVTAQVRSGALEAAMQLIDEADFSGNISQRNRWRAEWNVAQAMQTAGSVEPALRRIRLLLDESGSGFVDTLLDIRLRWLEAYLSLEAGSIEGLQERLSGLLARLETLPQGELSESAFRLLLTEIRLLRGNALIRSGAASVGIAELKALREQFTETAAAERSYLIEAAFHGEVADYESAQETLIELSERYPESRLAVQALYEAALYCERRGVDYYPDAIVLHNDLAEQYPQDPLYYYARLKQGNLLRAMNDFAGAQTVYENLINQYPAHERRYLAELSRADCLLALAGDEPGESVDAITQLERLLDLPNLPLNFQAEASYKWAFALGRTGRTARAKEVLSLSVAHLMPEPGRAEQLGASGRYWLARSMLRLGTILEEESATEEARRLYRDIIAFNLPGRNIAISRVDTLNEK